MYWKAFDILEPFGYQRDNLHAAIVSSTIANYSGRVNPLEPKQLHDFMLEPPEVKREREIKRMMAELDGMAKK